MSEIQNIQWFPGHMTKTKRKIQSSLKLVDAVAEILDARIPISSKNPDIANIIQNKPRVVLLNKCDMADKAATQKWINYYKEQNIPAIPVDCKSGKGLNNFVPTLNKVLNTKITALKSKGMVNPTLRVMIVGIPNVGKSSFINRVAKQSKAKVEDRPGVTRGNQWYTISKNFELLDTPGVLWPKFDDQTTAEHLAFTGAIKDQIMDTELLSMRLLELLSQIKPPKFLERFKLTDEILESVSDSYELLKLIGKKRGMLISGGEINTERAAAMILDEFRAAKLGQITLELPETGE
ncbi:MAG: ribosome biogenesis GTPase YlqF [Oscillospiraceae bacterium]|nr:ribosome biogenesis GTPase YlqF [Oscillospiraceae bacterium]